jgi:hypothetical protein
MRTRSYAIGALLLFPAIGLPQTIDPAEKMRTGTRYQNTLAVFREPQIFPSSNTDAEVYRIFVEATFFHALQFAFREMGTATF